VPRSLELADGVHQLSVQPGINCWVLVDGDEVSLIDAGLDRPGLVEGLARLGRAPGDVVRVLLTHGHPDHAGGVRRLRAAGGHASVAVGPEDLAVVQGRAPQPESDPDHRSARIFNRLPAIGPFMAPVEITDATALVPDLRLGVHGGIEVVPTPGHTPGHVAFHLLAHDLVIGGDALFNVFRLRPAPPFLCWRVPVNRVSIARLAELGPTTLALAHGRPVDGDVSGRLRQLLADRR
jgi:glyoxylase-like metal-dependent hydrolase (beta-lactamase superfamily II)